MGVYYITDNSLPELETSSRVLADLNDHLSDWLKRTQKSEKPEFREVVPPDGQKFKRYRLEVRWCCYIEIFTHVTYDTLESVAMQ